MKGPQQVYFLGPKVYINMIVESKRAGLGLTSQVLEYMGRKRVRVKNFMPVSYPYVHMVRRLDIRCQLSLKSDM
jgi:hypothetical protein